MQDCARPHLGGRVLPWDGLQELGHHVLHLHQRLVAPRQLLLQRDKLIPAGLGPTSPPEALAHRWHLRDTLPGLPKCSGTQTIQITESTVSSVPQRATQSCGVMGSGLRASLRIHRDSYPVIPEQTQDLPALKQPWGPPCVPDNELCPVGLAKGNPGTEGSPRDWVGHEAGHPKRLVQRVAGQ